MYPPRWRCAHLCCVCCPGDAVLICACVCCCLCSPTLHWYPGLPTSWHHPAPGRNWFLVALRCFSYTDSFSRFPVSLFPSTPLYLFLSISPPLFQSLCLYLSHSLSVCLYLSLPLSFSLSLSSSLPPLFQSVPLFSAFLPSLTVSLSLSTYLSLYSLSHTLCLSVYLFLHISLSLSVFLFLFFYLSLPHYLSVFLSTTFLLSLYHPLYSYLSFSPLRSFSICHPSHISLSRTHTLVSSFALSHMPSGLLSLSLQHCHYPATYSALQEYSITIFTITKYTL